MKEAIIAFVIALVAGTFINDYQDKEAAKQMQESIKGDPPAPSGQFSAQNEPSTNAPSAPPVDPDFEKAKQNRVANAKPPVPIDIPLLDDAGFDRDVIRSASPVFVYFKAQGSDACAREDKSVQDTASQVQAEVRVVAVDIMSNPIIAEQYGAQEVPSFAIFKDGKKVNMVAGELDKTTLVALIKKTVPELN